MELFQEIETASAAETEAFGASLARMMCEDPSIPPFIALYGDLGVGKTAFVRGFASVIAPNSVVRSPTFALVNEYRARPRSLFHFDMYRIDGALDLESIGFYDYLDGENVLCIEWSENIESELPDGVITITIRRIDDETREITVDGDERFDSLGN